MGTRPRTLARDVVVGFRRDVGGTIVEPHDEAYDEARAVWNGSIDRYPALIVRPAGVPGVEATIRRAREAGVPLAVRGGGHSIAGWSTRRYDPDNVFRMNHNVDPDVAGGPGASG